MDTAAGLRLFKAGQLYERLLQEQHGLDHLHEFHLGICKRCGKLLDSKDFLVMLNQRLIAEHFAPLELTEFSDLALVIEATTDEGWKELMR